MARSGLLGDTISEVFELGKSTVQNTGKSVGNTFSPLKIMEQNGLLPASGPLKSGEEKGMEQLEQGQGQKKNNNTPLDFNKLNDTYKKDDAASLQKLRGIYFQRVKSEEKQAIAALQNKEDERKKRELEEEEEKRRQIEAQKQQEVAQDVPRGKERKNMFSPKKKAQESHQEVKANRSKG